VWRQDIGHRCSCPPYLPPRWRRPWLNWYAAIARSMDRTQIKRVGVISTVSARFCLARSHFWLYEYNYSFWCALSWMAVQFAKLYCQIEFGQFLVCCSSTHGALPAICKSTAVRNMISLYEYSVPLSDLTGLTFINIIFLLYELILSSLQLYKQLTTVVYR